MWSKLQHWAAALACGLLLLNSSSAAWAASHKSSGKPVASKKSHVSKKSHKQSAKHKARQSNPSSAVVAESEVGSADLVESGDGQGLRGQASFYGKGFHGRKTSTGERFDARLFTAASNNFPLGTQVAVRRLDNDRCAIVKVNDRMHAKHRRRVIDVSHGVAEYLDMVRSGVVLVRVAALKAGGKDRSQSLCQSAFEPEKECVSCGRPPRLPDFGETTANQD